MNACIQESIFLSFYVARSHNEEMRSIFESGSKEISQAKGNAKHFRVWLERNKPGKARQDIEKLEKQNTIYGQA